MGLAVGHQNPILKVGRNFIQGWERLRRSRSAHARQPFRAHARIGQKPGNVLVPENEPLSQRFMKMNWFVPAKPVEVRIRVGDFLRRIEPKVVAGGVHGGPI